MHVCTNVHTHRHSGDKCRSLMAVKESRLIKLGGPGEQVGGEQGDGKALRLHLFVGSQFGGKEDGESV